jgi:hypothetical protein
MTNFTQPWGWSKLDVFRTCKKKFEYQFIDKRPEPGNAAMERGSKMHEDIEAYLQGWISQLPPELLAWKDRFDELKAENFTAEQAVGISKDWIVLPDWFDKRTWLRAKMDAKVLKGDKLAVIDFKSGKYRIPSNDQVELYAIVGQAMHPEVDEVTAEFWYIDQDDFYSKMYTKAELLQLRKKYEQEAGKIYSTEIWTESPSRDCKWCTYSKSKGGPCKF